MKHCSGNQCIPAVAVLANGSSTIWSRSTRHMFEQHGLDYRITSTCKKRLFFVLAGRWSSSEYHSITAAPPTHHLEKSPWGNAPPSWGGDRAAAAHLALRQLNPEYRLSSECMAWRRNWLARIETLACKSAVDRKLVVLWEVRCTRQSKNGHIKGQS